MGMASPFPLIHSLHADCGPKLFLVEGVLTVGLAIVFAFILPHSNKKIMGLNSMECEWVQWNYASDQGQEDNSGEVSATKGLYMAVVDAKTWLLMGILYSVRLS